MFHLQQTQDNGHARLFVCWFGHNNWKIIDYVLSLGSVSCKSRVSYSSSSSLFYVLVCDLNKICAIHGSTSLSNMIRYSLYICIFCKWHSVHVTSTCYNKRCNPQLRIIVIIGSANKRAHIEFPFCPKFMNKSKFT